ncbi:MAG: T9SS type A sorting domain-containing protein [Bacteroidetes bacterium]|nr:T9SS type A sorting domain-containing protein [Bacteroidota bacterium]
MKKVLLIIFLIFLFKNLKSEIHSPYLLFPFSIPITQASLNGSNMSTWIWNTGVFNQDARTLNTPGFEWPKGSGKFAIYSSGLSIGTYINDSLRLASISYNGEYAPGYINNHAGITNSLFKLYKISRGDNSSNNPDYANWGLMVPYGAPFVDVNNNNVFDPDVDKPGMRNASQTIFICLTDAFPENHNIAEGFSGGTLPIFSEMHLTAWCYDTDTSLHKAQFLKFAVINKNVSSWTKTYFGIVCDPDLGDKTDDYIGCDSVRSFGYCYNSDNQDGTGAGITYGLSPPAVGVDLLKGAVDKSGPTPVDLKMTSFTYFTKPSEGGISCEQDPQLPIEAYNYLRGLKKDSTRWVNARTGNLTKYCYNGDPEIGGGWTEFMGVIKNCGGTTTGNINGSNPGDRRFVIGSGSSNLTVSPGDTQTFIISQFAIRKSNNKNSVTWLKNLDDEIQNIYNSNFSVNVRSISSSIPENFSLFQNYPNPFNPSTKIKFEIAKSDFVNLTVFDLSGKVVEQLVNEKLNEGVYEVNFTSKNISSGIYFYRLSSSNFSQTNRMILVK